MLARIRPPSEEEDMKISLFAYASVAALIASLSMTTSAAANDCEKGFFKSKVVGTPGDAGSSFVCTTDKIVCPPSTVPLVQSLMYDQKAIDVSAEKAKFTYSCSYNRPPP